MSKWSKKAERPVRNYLTQNHTTLLAAIGEIAIEHGKGGDFVKEVFAFTWSCHVQIAHSLFGRDIVVDMIKELDLPEPDYDK